MEWNREHKARRVIINTWCRKLRSQDSSTVTTFPPSLFPLQKSLLSLSSLHFSVSLPRQRQPTPPSKQNEEIGTINQTIVCLCGFFFPWPHRRISYLLDSFLIFCFFFVFFCFPEYENFQSGRILHIGSLLDPSLLHAGPLCVDTIEIVEVWVP